MGQGGKESIYQDGAIPTQFLAQVLSRVGVDTVEQIGGDDWSPTRSYRLINGVMEIFEGQDIANNGFLKEAAFDLGQAIAMVPIGHLLTKLSADPAAVSPVRQIISEYIRYAGNEEVERFTTGYIAEALGFVEA